MLVSSVGYFNNGKSFLLNSDCGKKHQIVTEGLKSQDEVANYHEHARLFEILKPIKSMFPVFKDDCAKSLNMIA